MNLAGEAVRDDQIARLARLLGDDPLAFRLQTAVDHGVTIFALSPADRERILSLELDGHLGALKDRLADQRARQKLARARRERIASRDAMRSDGDARSSLAS